MTTNRIITESDRANAKRLSTLWKAKKHQLNLDQTKAAEMLGYSSQSMISQQLNCKAALNTDAIHKPDSVPHVGASTRRF